MQIVGCDGHTRPWPRYRCSKNWVPHVRPSFGLTWAHHIPKMPRGVRSPHVARSVSPPRILTIAFHHFRLLSSTTFLQQSTRVRPFPVCLERMRRDFQSRVYGYVVMPEHVHILLSEPERETLADAIHYLKLSQVAHLYRGPYLPSVGRCGAFRSEP